eukprot:699199-Pelagomonas_calceolata.AAC.1
MPTYGSSRRMLYQQECMRVRSGSLHIFKRGQRWIMHPEMASEILEVHAKCANINYFLECPP